ncbi:MAG: signal peptidase II [Aldersonia sp.]|nr:signal peptidase II [Aldersonia sp.]
MGADRRRKRLLQRRVRCGDLADGEVDAALAGGGVQRHGQRRSGEVLIGLCVDALGGAVLGVQRGVLDDAGRPSGRQPFARLHAGIDQLRAHCRDRYGHFVPGGGVHLVGRCAAARAAAPRNEGGQSHRHHEQHTVARRLRQVHHTHRLRVARERAACGAFRGIRDDGRVSTDRHDVPAASAAAASLPRLRLRMLLVIAAVVIAFDVLTKCLAVAFVEPGDPVRIIGDTVTLTLVRNPGAAFSMATGMTWLLTCIAVAVVIGVVRMARKLRSPWWALGLGLVLGGAIGNLIDRFLRSPGPLRGHVVDFVSVGWWPVFNVADSAVVCGAILMVVLTVFGVEPDGRKRHAV